MWCNLIGLVSWCIDAYNTCIVKGSPNTFSISNIYLCSGVKYEWYLFLRPVNLVIVNLKTLDQ